MAPPAATNLHSTYLFLYLLFLIFLFSFSFDIKSSFHFFFFKKIKIKERKRLIYKDDHTSNTSCCCISFVSTFGNVNSFRINFSYENSSSFDSLVLCLNASLLNIFLMKKENTQELRINTYLL
mgnify:CR=1 FL=1